MPAELSILDNIRIASPCNAKWDLMTGDDRARFCNSCQKHVYNLASLSAQEAENLIRDREGKMCARLYKRADGTVLTADCPIGARAVWQGTRKLIAAVSVAAVVGMATLILPRLVHGNSTPSGHGPIMSRAAIVWDDFLMWLGIRSPRVVAGDICVLPPSVPTANAPTSPDPGAETPTE